jgi:hypothetical protein
MNSTHRAYTASTYRWRAKTPPESRAQMCPLSDPLKDINIFGELAHERFFRPRPTAVSGSLDALRQAFVDRALEVSRHAASKAAASATFAKSPVACHHAQTPRPAERLETNARPQPLQHQPPAPHLPPSRVTPRDRHRRNDGVARRADPCSPSSPFMRHRVRRKWRGGSASARAAKS